MENPPNKWLPVLQMALSGLLAGKDLAGLQGLEKSLANVAMAMLGIWDKAPESELAKAIDMLFEALRDKNEPAIAALSTTDRFTLSMAVNMIVKGRKALNG